MRTLDATTAGPLQLLDDLAGALAVEGVALLDHGADIAPKRLGAAMSGLARGLSLRWRQRTGRRLSPGTAPGEVRVIGLYARVPADIPGRDPGRFQSLWVLESAIEPGWRALSGRPGTTTLHLGQPVPTAAP